MQGNTYTCEDVPAPRSQHIPDPLTKRTPLVFGIEVPIHIAYNKLWQVQDLGLMVFRQTNALLKEFCNKAPAGTKTTKHFYIFFEPRKGHDLYKLKVIPSIYILHESEELSFEKFTQTILNN